MKNFQCPDNGKDERSEQEVTEKKTYTPPTLKRYTSPKLRKHKSYKDITMLFAVLPPVPPAS